MQKLTPYKNIISKGYGSSTMIQQGFKEIRERETTYNNSYIDPKQQNRPEYILNTKESGFMKNNRIKDGKKDFEYSQPNNEKISEYKASFK